MNGCKSRTTCNTKHRFVPVRFGDSVHLLEEGWGPNLILTSRYFYTAMTKMCRSLNPGPAWFLSITVSLLESGKIFLAEREKNISERNWKLILKSEKARQSILHKPSWQLQSVLDKRIQAFFTGRDQKKKKKNSDRLESNINCYEVCLIIKTQERPGKWITASKTRETRLGHCWRIWSTFSSETSGCTSLWKMRLQILAHTSMSCSSIIFSGLLEKVISLFAVPYNGKRRQTGGCRDPVIQPAE